MNAPKFGRLVTYRLCQHCKKYSNSNVLAKKSNP